MNETDGKDGKIGAGSSRNAQFLLAVDGEIVAQYAPAETKHGDVDGEQPGTGQEEAVEERVSPCS